MFTVKFVTLATPECVDERIELHQCTQVRVFAEPHEELPGSGSVGCQPPQRSTMMVELVDDQRRPFHSARIEHGRWSWNTAYVLNDKGRTIQTIVPNAPA
jgi:hypothetical protein